ncbi:hypothetical protein ABW21_db0206644 [Orbilia brochopaga]|nr:hypothetical protein ABW21_db0206644 [Drechslerella brochopaga]
MGTPTTTPAPAPALPEPETTLNVSPWKTLAVKTRWNRIRNEAELQQLEDNFHRDLVERSLVVDPSMETPESQLATQIKQEEAMRALERLALESSRWVIEQVVDSKRPTKKTVDADPVEQMMALAAYHRSPEYHAKQAKFLRDLEPKKKNNPITSTMPGSDLDYSDEISSFSQAEFFMEKHREQVELMATFRALEEQRAAAQSIVDQARRYFIEFPEREAQRLKDEKARHVRNMAALEERFAAEDREKEERRLAEIARIKKEAEIERARKAAAEQAKRDAEQAKRDAEAKAEEERRAREKKEREEAEQQRQLAEQQRQLTEQQRQLAQQERAKKQREEAERLRREEAERAQNEKAEKAKAREQTQTAMTSKAEIQAEILGEAQRMVSTMPYLSQDALSHVRTGITQQVGYRYAYLAAMAKTVPTGSVDQKTLEGLSAIFLRYGRTRYNLEFVLIRSKAVKITYRCRDLTDLKYKMAKRVTQMVGTKASYFEQARELIKLLTEVGTNIQQAGLVSNIAISDFALQRQPKETLAAPPVTFLAVYNFTKTILTKAIAEGPDDMAMLKALAMVLNSVIGGRAKYWPAVAVSSLVWARFWFFSPTLFGAMGKDSDLGYKEGDTPTDVARKAEVVAALFCHMAIIRPANVRREQAILIEDVEKALEANLNVPPHLRTELHYVNIRTIMRIAPWSLRAHLGPQGVVNLDARIRTLCQEDVGTKLKGNASLLYNRMDELQSQGYTNQMRQFGCDEWKYWDLDEIRETNAKRASVDQIHPDQVQIDEAVTAQRIQASEKLAKGP